MILGLGNILGAGQVSDIGPPEGSLPADAYQQPISEGDEGYWRSGAGGYYQEPLP